MIFVGGILNCPSNVPQAVAAELNLSFNPCGVGFVNPWLYGKLQLLLLSLAERG